MSRRNRIVELELEDVVKDGLERGLTRDQIGEELNVELVARHDAKSGKPPVISKPGLDRYLDHTLPKETARALHTAKNAEANAAWSINLAARLQKRMEKLDVWLEQMDELELRDEHGKSTGIADWDTRRKMFAEEREWLKMVADLLDRVHNQEQIQMFQRSILETLREVDPEVARQVIEKLQKMRSARQAGLLGLDAGP